MFSRVYRWSKNTSYGYDDDLSYVRENIETSGCRAVSDIEAARNEGIVVCFGVSSEISTSSQTLSEA